MTIINELQLSKDLIRFQSITPKDLGAISYLSKKLKKLGFGGSQSVWNTPGGSEKYGEQHTKVPGRSPKKMIF